MRIASLSCEKQISIEIGEALAPTAPAMPSLGWVLTDEEVANVLTYVRNSWGNAAPAVSAADVKAVREDLQPR